MTSDFESILQKIGKGNPFGEQVTLVAATKTRTAEEIGQAIKAGVRDIGENRVQEFCANTTLYTVRGGTLSGVCNATR